MRRPEHTPVGRASAVYDRTGVAALDALAGPLYRGAMADFTAARNRVAAELAKAGEVAMAKAVKGLPKPSATAWAVDQLHWTEPERIEALLHAAAQLRAALASAAEPAIQQRCAAVHRQQLQAATDLACTRLREAGHAPSVAVRRRVMTTLEALAAAGRWPAPGPGCLAEDLDPPGFEALAAGLPIAPLPVGEQDEPAANRPALEALRQAEAALEAASARVHASERALDRAIDRERDAAAARDAAAVALLRAQQQLDAAETAFVEHTRAREQSQAQHDVDRDALARARRELDAVRDRS